MSEGKPSPARDMTGRELAGCRIVDLISQGAMGDVYRAQQISLKRTVAIKVLAPELSRNPALIQRFQREARAVGRLSHQNVAAVYDFGQADDLHYIVMEYVPGESLEDIARQREQLEYDDALNFLIQATAGTAQAHQAGILHRDIKPRNLLVTTDGVLKVVDFGLAKTEHETTAPEITTSGNLMGTPNYMSPEQSKGMKVTAASDIYCLGGTFYRLLAGHTCFPLANPVAVILKHQSEEPLPPYLFRPDLPCGYSEVIMKCLAKSPGDRYAHAGELLEDLQRLKGGQIPEAVRSGFGTQPVDPAFHRDLYIVRGLRQYNLATPEQIEEVLRVQAQLDDIGVRESIDQILVRKGIVPRREMDRILAAVRRSQYHHADQAFLAVIQQRHLVPGDHLLAAQRELQEAAPHMVPSLLCQRLIGREDICYDDLALALREVLQRAREREEQVLRKALVRRGQVSLEALDAAVSAARAAESPGVCRRIDQIAVTAGLVSTRDVDGILRWRLRKVFGTEPAAPASRDPSFIFPELEAVPDDAPSSVTLGREKARGILPDMEAMKMETAMSCPHCGKEVPVRTPFCTFCNHPTHLARSSGQKRPTRGDIPAAPHSRPEPPGKRPTRADVPAVSPPPRPEAPVPPEKRPTRIDIPAVSPPPKPGHQVPPEKRPTRSDVPAVSSPPRPEPKTPAAPSPHRDRPGHLPLWVARMPAGELTRPLTLSEVEELIAQDRIRRDTPLQTPSSGSDWVPAGSVAELARHWGVCRACGRPVRSQDKTCPHCRTAC